MGGGGERGGGGGGGVSAPARHGSRSRWRATRSSIWRRCSGPSRGRPRRTGCRRRCSRSCGPSSPPPVSTSPKGRRWTPDWSGCGRCTSPTWRRCRAICCSRCRRGTWTRRGGTTGRPAPGIGGGCPTDAPSPGSARGRLAVFGFAVLGFAQPPHHKESESREESHLQQDAKEGSEEREHEDGKHFSERDAEDADGGQLQDRLEHGVGSEHGGRRPYGERDEEVSPRNPLAQTLVTTVTPRRLK